MYFQSRGLRKIGAEIRYCAENRYLISRNRLRSESKLKYVVILYLKHSVQK
jgi:hypothetical protein